ncbi:MAG TPA: bacteriohopanetetrol glucosamine biosynthesis glycosyltransferase HpnI, partial [Candidatus Aquilonibacter sp.]
VQRSDDPAIEVIQRVIAQYPGADLSLVVGQHSTAANPKVANLANMLACAKYDLLFIADADMRVDRTYLATVSAEFSSDRVGAATCLYVGVPRGGLASELGAMHLNDQFAPSVLVATLGGPPRFCFGSTMAVRRNALDAIGGIAALEPHLADDYMLGALVSAHGYRVALSRYVVRNVIAERSVPALLEHELRWARTIRSVQTAGYAFSFVTFPLPFAIVWFALAPASAGAWIALALLLALRAAMHYAARDALGAREKPPVWLLPLRDCLGLGVWAAGLFGTTVMWKNEERSISP